MCASGRSSRESEGSTSGLNVPDSPSPGSARSTPTVGPSSANTGPTFPATTMFEASTRQGSATEIDQTRLDVHAKDASNPLTSSAEVSPASRSATQDVDEEQPTRAGSGPTLLGSFASYNPATSSWKTLTNSAPTLLETSPGTWPRAGMTQSGTAYRLRPLVPPISEIGSIYWPTPVSDDRSHRGKPYSQGGRALSYMLGGPPNPDWQEWLMGLPVGWTALPGNAVESSAQQSSRKSSNTSGEGS